MKKSTVLLGLLAAVSVVLVSCGTEKPAKESTKDKKEEKNLSLSVGTMPAVDSLPVYIADKKGFFKEEGLDLDLQSFKSPKDRDAALSSGNLDGANTDLIALSTYLQGGMDVKVVSQSIGNFSILTGNDEIKNLADLEGKKVGHLKNQAPYYFLNEALKKENIDPSKVGYEEVPQIPVRIELVKNQKLDATVVPEPFRTIGLSSGLKELGNSSEMGIHATVFGFTAESLKDNKEAVEAFYRGYNKGVDYINEHKLDDYYDVLKEKIGFTDEIKDQVKLPEYTHAKQIEEEQLTNAFNWSEEQGIYKKEFKASDILSPLLKD
ncbi:MULTISPECIES: ABC transporter substrate-binding protein [Vagococcus]|uniref:Thiamine biosynthesis protein, putative n=1 Tax=Vagococcus fluvialis bH819 TaxID=1255619 RepID=A0A1X6WN50_9ENTE|nr:MULTISPECIES: ABC transporter substrate-binding protein [Vagococcus]SLM85678.1 thiamine biosynthesis protein, putative [Vagococcus fluvialis bH819]HCM89645.1 NlpA lipoprotein [Vagococcus sp.]